MSEVIDIKGWGDNRSGATMANFQFRAKGGSGHITFTSTFGESFPAWTVSSAICTYSDESQLQGIATITGEIGPTSLRIEVVQSGVIITGQLDEPIGTSGTLLGRVLWGRADQDGN
jgi:hypothetical protein